MKRYWNSYLTIVLVLLVVGASAFLQYRWQVKIGNADIEKMQASVDRDAERFVEDFNREIQSAYFNFRLEAQTWRSGDTAEFNTRYAYWKENTAYPELIETIWLKEVSPEAKLKKYSVDQKTFIAEENEQIAEIISRRENETNDNGNVIAPDLPALILPIQDMRLRVFVKRDNAQADQISTPEKYGNLVIILNNDVIKDNFLPDLVKKNFPQDDFNVVVKNAENIVFTTNKDVTNADAVKGIFNVTPNLMVFASRVSSGIKRPDVSDTVVVDRRRETKSFTTDISPKDGNRAVEIETRTGDSIGRTSVFSTTTNDKPSNAWQLLVQHKAGSIKQFVDANTWRDILIGFGLLLLIAVSILAIFFSARRMRLLAQRQVDFVSSVSHEFRTPLAVIYAAGENLADGVADDQENVAKYGNLIKGEGKKLNAMVEQILEFAGASSGKRKYRFEQASIKEIVLDAVNESSPLLDVRHFEVDLDLEENLPDIIVDKEAITNAVNNLIANSAKYSNGSKWLGISVKNDEKIVSIAIKDRGIGISRSDVKEIFEPFFRSKEVVDAQIHGNGLGLAIVKQIVDAHQGKLSVSSELGAGSEFRIDLPIDSSKK